MKKKTLRIITIVATILVILSSYSFVFAEGPGDYIGYENKNGGVGQKFDETAERILGLIRAIGSIISVAVLLILGIKYMMGSAEEKAEYKKTMLPYVIGAIVLFAASTIGTAIFEFAGNIHV